MAVFAQSAPCWVDVQLSDLEAGKRFYGGLFGWTFRAGDGMPFADAYSDGELVAALAAKQDGRMPTTWGVYFSTDDILATVALVRKAGGQVITDPVRAGAAGVLAQAADPGGAVFGLWQAGERAGFEKRNAPGSFCWTEVHTRRTRARGRLLRGGTRIPGDRHRAARLRGGAGALPRLVTHAAPNPARTRRSAGEPSSRTPSPRCCPATS